jgi:AraC-like DNA-binding protein/quercetin dioxygenase-like cupin family protein
MTPRNIARRTEPGPDARPVPVEELPRPVVARATDYPDGHRITLHWHPRAQLLYARRGVMTVTTARGIFVVPPQRAVWVPARMAHAVRASGRLEMRSLYLDPAAVPAMPDDCAVVTATPLLRALILEAIALPPLYPLGGREERIMSLILDEIHALKAAPLHLPEPRDGRLRRIADALRADPADGRTLAQWGRLVGASARTLARRFQAETGLTFALWRQQARLLEALVRLAAGVPVTAVALDLGYDSPSAFIAMFRRALGTTPGRYFD